MAVEKKSYQICQFLIENGADIDAKNKHGKSAIHIAVESEDAKMIELLIGAGADVNSKNNRKETPLFIAIEMNSFHIVQKLISYGAEINLFNEKGRSPLYIAVGIGAKGITKLLISKGAETHHVNAVGETILEQAKNPSYEVLYFSLMRGRYKGVQVALQEILDLNDNRLADELPLELAVNHFNPNPKIIEQLILHGAEPYFLPPVTRKKYDRYVQHIKATKILGIVTGLIESKIS